MAKKKTCNPLGYHTPVYGWMGMSPSEFAYRMKLANVRFRALKKEHKFDAIAFSGSSGCAIAFNLASRNKIPLIYVRKDGEKSHSSSLVECNDKRVIVKKYLIVDDLVDSGTTVAHIISSIELHAEQNDSYPAIPCGVLCLVLISVKIAK